ncbi:ABC transporter ATP-binding protein [Petrachloros mirabilis]
MRERCWRTFSTVWVKPMAEVRIEHLSKRFGTTTVLPDVTLTIRDGEFFTIVGPSGCGKSTLLQLLAGLDRPTSGRILFDGVDVTALEPRERDVALVFQSYALYPHMTVRDNLSFPLRVTKRKTGLDQQKIEGEVQRVAGLLGLAPLLDRWPRELSGGQRQRVALGRALIRQPKLFLLDEPLSNLDAQLRSVMRAELRQLHDRLGTTMIYVTHDQTEAMTLADRVAVLDRGVVQQIGPPQALYDRPGNLFVAKFLGHPAINVLEGEIHDGGLRIGALIPFVSAVECGDRLDEGTKVVVGIRPEHVSILSGDGPGRVPHEEGRQVSGIVRLLEYTGSQTWGVVEVDQVGGGTMMIGGVPSGDQLRPGQSVSVSLTGASYHLFDVETGRRLGGI